MSDKLMTALLAESVLLTKVTRIVAGYSPVTIILVGAITLFFVIYNKRRARMVQLIDKIPGPAAMPLLGNSIEMNVDHDGKY
ncbi:unnamed protein product [Ceratitis capitata]|uniref:(Mediterranean fruit fly) hypothetical protein n=1 Tax=Ceratitis capitata TaxID=7213 RepID=A0A811U1X0_CERCA|nr:unnamed protein product [Ceratitis capitata]